jgi:hypothetical protein
VSVFYSPFGDDATPQLGTFFNAIKGNFPSSVTWSIPSSGDILNDADGALTGAWTGGTAASYAGTTAGAYAGGTGAYVRWITGVVVGRRKLQGRTFLCPVLTSLYDTSGTINDPSIVSMLAAATSLAVSGKLVIWHRPSGLGATDGSSATVVGAAIPDKVTSLKSRRT